MQQASALLGHTASICDESRRICCEETDRARIDELSLHQERNPTTVSHLLAQIQNLQKKANSLSDARAFQDPESGSSSRATHVPSQPSTILSPRTVPRCDSGLPRDARNFTGTPGNVLERPPAQEGRSSTFFDKNLASSYQVLRPDLAVTTRETSGCNVKRTVEYVSPFTTFPKRRWHVESYWWNFSQWNDGLSENSLFGIEYGENFLTLWNFKAGKSIRD